MLFCQFGNFYIYEYKLKSMIILEKDAVNELILNINNNSREDFTSYLLVFKHILSQKTKSYTVDTSDNAVYGFNNRYCEINLDMTGTEQLQYEGQYELKIYGDGNLSKCVYTMMCRLEGTSEDNSFIEYVSNNEDNESYIYID